MKKWCFYLLSFLFCFQTRAIEPKDFSFYGTISLVSAIDFENGSQALGDNSSRIGILYETGDVLEDWKVGLRGEWAVNTNKNNSGFGSNNFNGKQYDVVANDGPFGNRLGYLWMQKDNLFIAAGKIWSVFYDVPEFTDLLYTDGARASSAYTVTGEVDGTYRASEIVQIRYQYHDLHFGFQTKLTGKETIEYDFDEDGVAESNLIYKQVQALSVRYIKKPISLGFSAINMMFDNNGDGESQLSLSYGLKIDYQNFFANVVYTRAKDLELNLINNRFVNSDGTEVILGHRFENKMLLMLGLNHQYRTESGRYDLLYYYFSLSKRLKNLTIAAEYVLGERTESDRSKVDENLIKLAVSLGF